MTIHQPELKHILGKHYADIRARLMNPANAYKPPTPEAKPAWKTSQVHFDWHVKAWQWYLAGLKTDPNLIYIKQRCKDLLLNEKKVLTKDRAKVIVNGRRQIMWELRTKFDISFPSIGKLFGGIDHATVMYNVQKYQEELDGLYVPKPTGINRLRADTEAVAKARDAYENGMSIEKAAKSIGYTKAILIKLARDQGWYNPGRALAMAYSLGQMRRDYESGMSIKKLSKKHGISERTWGHIKHKLNIPTRPHNAQWRDELEAAE